MSFKRGLCRGRSQRIVHLNVNGRCGCDSPGVNGKRRGSGLLCDTSRRCDILRTNHRGGASHVQEGPDRHRRFGTRRQGGRHRRRHCIQIRCRGVAGPCSDAPRGFRRPEAHGRDRASGRERKPEHEDREPFERLVTRRARSRAREATPTLTSTGRESPADRQRAREKKSRGARGSSSTGANSAASRSAWGLCRCTRNEIERTIGG